MKDTEGHISIIGHTAISRISEEPFRCLSKQWANIFLRK